MDFNPSFNSLWNTEILPKWTRFNGVYSRHNLPKKIKYGAYVINLDEHADVSTRWIALYGKNIEIIYFGSFGVECVPKKMKICWA